MCLYFFLNLFVFPNLICNNLIWVLQADFPITSSNEPNAEKVLFDNKISDTVMPDHDEIQDRALVSLNPNDRHLRKIQTIDSKENLISQTALKFLFRKREQLVCLSFFFSSFFST